MTAKHSLVLTILWLTLWVGPLHSQTHHHAHDHEPQSTTGHESHVHGIAELLVVFEGDELNMEFHSPAMNVLGFEHRVKSAEQKTAVENARKRFADASVLFQFSPINCELVEQALSFGDLLEHEHNHTDESTTADSHSDIEATYRFRCEQAGVLKSLSTKLPEIFSGIESLQVQWIVNGRQGATTLDNRQHTIVFK